MNKSTKRQKRFASMKEAATIFGLTVPTMWKYKDLGLIEIAEKKSNQDLFGPQDLRKRRKIIFQKKIKDFTLRQISRIIDQESRKVQKKSKRR